MLSLSSHAEVALSPFRLFYPQNTSGRFVHKYSNAIGEQSVCHHLHRVKLKRWRHSKRLWCAQVANHNDSCLHKFTHDNCVRCIHLWESIPWVRWGIAANPSQVFRLHKELSTGALLFGNRLKYENSHVKVAAGLLKHTPESTNKVSIRYRNIVAILFVLLIPLPCCFNIFFGQIPE